MLKKLLYFLLLIFILTFGSACEREEGIQIISTDTIIETPIPHSVVEQTVVEQTQSSKPRFQLIAEKQEDGVISLQVAGGATIFVKSSITIKDTIYSYIEISMQDPEGYIDALVALSPNTLQTNVLFSQEMNDTNNIGYNSFLRNPGILGELENGRFLFLEPEVSGNQTMYHLSAYNVKEDEFEKLRSDFWNVGDYDYIYQYKWSNDKRKIMLQSFEGNVWIVDVLGGSDHVHVNQYRVIHHSTTGYPSLFVSPTLERFAFDDESGKVTFYSDAGHALQAIELPTDATIPSQKVKWNDAGTIAWVASTTDHSQIKAVDIDMLQIAPSRINFYDLDGFPIRSIEASDVEGGSIEVVQWLDPNTVVLKEYKYDATQQLNLRETEVKLFSYNVDMGEKMKYDQPLRIQQVGADQENQYMNFKHDYSTIHYVKQRPLVKDIDDAHTRLESFLFKDSDSLATFRKIPELPYGLFVPDIFDSKKTTSGFAWGYGEEGDWNGITIYSSYSMKPDVVYSKAELSIYEEYIGSNRGGNTNEDYFIIPNREHELFITFTYTDDEQQFVYHILQGMLEDIRYVHSREQFESGVFLQYDEQSYRALENDIDILALIEQCLHAIVKKDTKSFTDTLESQELAEALMFFFNNGTMYRFEEAALDGQKINNRINVNIGFQALSVEGFHYKYAYTLTIRPNKQGVWKIANID